MCIFKQFIKLLWKKLFPFCKHIRQTICTFGMLDVQELHKLNLSISLNSPCLCLSMSMLSISSDDSIPESRAWRADTYNNIMVIMRSMSKKCETLDSELSKVFWTCSLRFMSTILLASYLSKESRQKSLKDATARSEAEVGITLDLSQSCN